MSVTLLVIARGLFVACALSGFGAALFATTLMAPVIEGPIERRVRSVMRLSLATALPIGLAWLALEARSMAGARTLAETVAAIPEVLFHTSFGYVLASQGFAIAGALAAMAILRWPSLLALGLAGLAVLLEAGHGHGFAMADNALLLSQALHLLASGAWLGALMPLLIVVRDTSLAHGSTGCAPLRNARVDLRGSARQDRALSRLRALGRLKRSHRDRLWRGAPDQGRDLRSAARVRGGQSLAAYTCARWT